MGKCDYLLSDEIFATLQHLFVLRIQKIVAIITCLYFRVPNRDSGDHQRVVDRSGGPMGPVQRDMGARHTRQRE